MFDPISVEELARIFKTNKSNPNRIISREGITIEFKESFNLGGMAQYFKTMASFANNSGGYIIFGIGDKPRELLGLSKSSLEQFENLKVEEFTKNLLDYFSPEIQWNHCTYEHRDKSFGIIYTYPLTRKPCICKKSYDASNVKYSLKEGDIFYRYGGRSERIRYDELEAIMDSSRKDEECQWIEFIKRATKIGIENACLLDLDSGILTGKSGSVVIDESLLSKIAFIREGEFVESKGKPTLRLIGDIREISSGKKIVQERTKKVVRAIEPGEIIVAFLEDRNVDEPIEYVKLICNENSANYPLYYYINKTERTIDYILDVINAITVRGRTKDALLERLNGRKVNQTKIPSNDTQTTRSKIKYRQDWLSNKIGDEFSEKELNYCMEALMSLDDNEIVLHEKDIKKSLLKLYLKYYENAKSAIAGNIRKAICRVDEAVYPY